MLPQSTLDTARDLLAQLEARGLTLATAESCTGGLIAAALTAIPGSSAVVTRGYVTYSNEAKQEMLGVPADVLAHLGAVSEAVARAMAEGALRASGADLALSCTGIAGPGGATPGKPVGLVFIGAARRGAEPHVLRRVFPGDRAAVRAATVAEALVLARDAIGLPHKES
jgi:nicotinamide-nucleotide amidase